MKKIGSNVKDRMVNIIVGSTITNINTMDLTDENNNMDVIPGAISQLTSSLLPYESDALLGWLARLPVECNHPRSLINSKDPQLTIHRSGDVMVLPITDKLIDAFKKLVTEGFSSAPVIDNNNQYIGFIDLLDIAWYCVQKFGAWREQEKLVDEKQRNDYWSRYISTQPFNSISVGDVFNRPAWVNRNFFNPIYTGFSTLYPIEFMARTGCHRMALINNQNKIISILTQSMVISLFDQNLNQFPSLRNYKVRRLLPGLTSTLITCNDNDLAIDAFQKIIENKIRGLPIIDKKGILVDTISIRDLRVIGTNTQNYYRLWSTVLELKHIVRKEFSQQTPHKPITVTKEDTFEAVLRKMDDGNIHRVYVVENNNNGDPIPSHVISQRDILRFVLHRIGLAPTTVEQAV